MQIGVDRPLDAIRALGARERLTAQRQYLGRKRQLDGQDEADHLRRAQLASEYQP